jgi:hypothetical protein
LAQKGECVAGWGRNFENSNNIYLALQLSNQIWRAMALIWHAILLKKFTDSNVWYGTGMNMIRVVLARDLVEEIHRL